MGEVERVRNPRKDFDESIRNLFKNYIPRITNKMIGMDAKQKDWADWNVQNTDQRVEVKEPKKMETW